MVVVRSETGTVRRSWRGEVAGGDQEQNGAKERVATTLKTRNGKSRTADSLSLLQLTDRTSSSSDHAQKSTQSNLGETRTRTGKLCRRHLRRRRLELKKDPLKRRHQTISTARTMGWDTTFARSRSSLAQHARGHLSCSQRSWSRTRRPRWSRVHARTGHVRVFECL